MKAGHARSFQTESVNRGKAPSPDKPCRPEPFARGPSRDCLSADRRTVGEYFHHSRHGRGRRFFVRHVRCGRWLSDHPAADFLQYSASRGRGDGRQPGGGLLRFRLDHAFPAWNPRRQARQRSARRRPPGGDGRRVDILLPAQHRPARSHRFAALRHPARHRRRVDAEGKHFGTSPRRPQRNRDAAPAGTPQLGTPPAAENAVQNRRSISASFQSSRSVSASAYSPLSWVWAAVSSWCRR